MLLLLLLLVVVVATDYIVNYCCKCHLRQDPDCPRKLARVNYEHPYRPEEELLSDVAQ